jgi:circadian clock protein KaiB
MNALKKIKTRREHPAPAPVRSSAFRRFGPGTALRPLKTEQPTARKFVLRLFIAGATDRSRQAVLRVRQLCEAELKDRCKLEVIDIYQQPGLARKNQIVATPTLIIEFPPPLRRFIGNLANITGLFVELDLITKGKIAL